MIDRNCNFSNGPIIFSKIVFENNEVKNKTLIISTAKEMSSQPACHVISTTLQTIFPVRKQNKTKQNNSSSSTVRIVFTKESKRED